MSYRPKQGDIAGFDLFARLQPDGTIITGGGTKLPKFPDEVTVNGATFTLEYVKINEVDSPVHPGADIRWGVYV